MRMTRSGACGVAGGLLCIGLVGCSYPDGVNYSVHGLASFSTNTIPPSGVNVVVVTSWSGSGNAIDLGGSHSSTSTSAPTAIGSWQSTGDSRSYRFEVVVQIYRPSGGEDLSQAQSVNLQGPGSYGYGSYAYGTIVSQDAGEEEDGWYDGEVSATFDCTSW
jgi:hypothetical protein